MNNPSDMFSDQYSERLFSVIQMLQRSALMNMGAEKVLCTDISDILLKKGKEAGFIDEYSQQNGENLSFKDNSYDVVICSEVLEHVEDPEIALKELARVLKKGGKLAVSVPRFFPEWLCWKISDEYSKTPGGHVRIFRHSQLRKLATVEGLRYLSFHWAHGLHSPYWWLQCLFWKNKEKSFLVKKYHQFLVWDLMKKPFLTRILEFILQPLIGKSVVMYFRKPS